MTNNYENEFKWFTPSPKSNLAITIPNKEAINLNAKFLEKAPKTITIGVSPDDATLAIKEVDIGFNVPKSGRVKAQELISYIQSLGVHLPAKYDVEEKVDFWIAKLDSTYLPKIKMKKAPRKVKKEESKSIIAELNKNE